MLEEVRISTDGSKPGVFLLYYPKGNVKNLKMKRRDPFSSVGAMKSVFVSQPLIVINAVTIPDTPDPVYYVNCD